MDQQGAALFWRGGILWARAAIADGTIRRWSLRTSDEAVARHRLARKGQIGLSIGRARALANNRRSLVYFIGQLGLVKIGRSLDVDRRFKSLQAGSPVKLRMLFVLRGGAKQEAALHARFHALRCHNEWFRLEGPLLDFCRRRIGASCPALLACLKGGPDAQT